ncbi:MAG: hypothetical protein KJP23_00805 [Deltaproteobacteria bacterium]|nr:hypothetical protein [Deltaproteobacteria bacterium]
MKAKSKKAGRPPASPIDLSQEEVDKMTAGGAGARLVTRRIRASVPSGPLGKISSPAASPVPITRKEMEIIRRKGKPRKRVLAKIAKSTLEKSGPVKSRTLSTRKKNIPDRIKP